MRFSTELPHSQPSSLPLFFSLSPQDMALVSSCVWCSEPGDFPSDLLYRFCVGDEGAKHVDHERFFARAEESLSTCFGCVVSFHQSLLVKMKSQEFANKGCIIYERIVARISKTMKAFLEQEDDQDCAGYYDHAVLVALFEALKNPRVLLDAGLNALLTESLRRLISNGEGAGLLQEKLPGLYLLLVHPDNQVNSLILMFCLQVCCFFDAASWLLQSTFTS